MRYLLFAVVISLIHAPTAEARRQRQLTQPDLRSIANDALNRQSISYEAPKVDIDPNAKSLSYFGGLIKLPLNLPVDEALYVQTKLELHRRQYGKGLIAAFWEPVVRSAESQISHKMLPIVYDTQLTDEQKLAKLNDTRIAIESMLMNAAFDWAKKNGYSYGASEAAPAEAQITIMTQPANAVITKMHILTYIALQKQGLNPMPLMRPVANGDTVPWAGREVVMAVFPDKRRSGPYDFTFERGGLLTLFRDHHTFQPEGK